MVTGTVAQLMLLMVSASWTNCRFVPVAATTPSNTAVDRALLSCGGVIGVVGGLTECHHAADAGIFRAVGVKAYKDVGVGFVGNLSPFGIT